MIGLTSQMRLSSTDQDNILESVRVTLRLLLSPPTPPLEEEEEEEDSTKINLNTLSVNARYREKKSGMWHSVKNLNGKNSIQLECC